MSEEFKAFQAHCRQRCEALLPSLLNSNDHATEPARERLLEASRYSLLNGGKRIRPMLVYAAGQATNPQGSDERLDYPACAMELIHVYSLVHDDLPAMDDDDLRRGKPSCHRAFDEATAILVGDGLQALAFELLSDAPGLDAGQRIAMVKLLAGAAGSHGMVGGQAIDMAATDRDISLEALGAMHRLKTGALIRAALALGGVAAGADAARLRALDAYGHCIGLAFQVVDDILDVEENTATLGKTGGKDDQANKSTYVKLLGLAGAKARSRELQREAHDTLRVFGDSAERLHDLADYIVERRF